MWQGEDQQEGSGIESVTTWEGSVAGDHTNRNVKR